MLPAHCMFHCFDSGGRAAKNKALRNASKHSQYYRKLSTIHLSPAVWKVSSSKRGDGNEHSMGGQLSNLYT